MSTRGYSGLRRAFTKSEIARASETLGNNVVLDIFVQCRNMEKAQRNAMKRTNDAYLRKHPELRGERDEYL